MAVSANFFANSIASSSLSVFSPLAWARSSWKIFSSKIIYFRFSENLFFLYKIRNLHCLIQEFSKTSHFGPAQDLVAMQLSMNAFFAISFFKNAHLSAPFAAEHLADLVDPSGRLEVLLDEGLKIVIL